MQAAQVAVEAGAKRLLLNHISARFSQKISASSKKTLLAFLKMSSGQRLGRSGNLKRLGKDKYAYYSNYRS